MRKLTNDETEQIIKKAQSIPAGIKRAEYCNVLAEELLGKRVIE